MSTTLRERNGVNRECEPTDIPARDAKHCLEGEKPKRGVARPGKPPNACHTPSGRGVHLPARAPRTGGEPTWHSWRKCAATREAASVVRPPGSAGVRERGRGQQQMSQPQSSTSISSLPMGPTNSHCLFHSACQMAVDTITTIRGRIGAKSGNRRRRPTSTTHAAVARSNGPPMISPTRARAAPTCANMRRLLSKHSTCSNATTPQFHAMSSRDGQTHQWS